MIQIIQTVDLSKMWGKEKDKPSVVDVWEGQLFNVTLDKGEMLGQKYSCDIKVLAKLEKLHGQNNVVVISKSTKGKENGEGGFYYNDVITDVITLAKYAKINVVEEVYVSKFAQKSVKKPVDGTVPKTNQHETINDHDRDRG